MIPTNEQETIALFSQLAEELGYAFLEMGTRCPDAILEKNGQRVRVKFEHVSKNFLRHKHNPNDVDLVICWQDDWGDCPLPVLALESYVTLARPMPKWKRFLAWMSEYKITRMEHRARVRGRRARKEATRYCPGCGDPLVAECSLYNDKTDKRTLGFCTFSCKKCRYEWIKTVEWNGWLGSCGGIE